MADYVRPEVLVDTAWLVGHLHDPDIRVIEVDEDTTAYEKGHIEGAIGWNWFVDLHDPLRRDYADQAGLPRLLAAPGVGPNTPVLLFRGDHHCVPGDRLRLVPHRGLDPG